MWLDAPLECIGCRYHGRAKMYFMVVGNVHYEAFARSHELQERYDIKGSVIQRNFDPIAYGSRVRCRLCEEYFIYL